MADHYRRKVCVDVFGNTVCRDPISGMELPMAGGVKNRNDLKDAVCTSSSTSLPITVSEANNLADNLADNRADNRADNEADNEADNQKMNKLTNLQNEN